MRNVFENVFLNKMQCICSILIFTGIQAFADTSSPCYFFQCKPVITLSAGGLSVNTHSNQTIPVYGSNYPYITDTYVNNDSSQTGGLGGIFIGLQFPLNSDFSWQTGLSYYHTSDFTENGILHQFSNFSMDYDNFNYSYKFSSQQLLWESKFSTSFHTLFHPYIVGGIGPSWNEASNYSETSRYDYSGPPHIPFANHTTSNLSYLLGFGIDMNLSSHFLIGIGYRFDDFGKLSLGQSPAMESGATLVSSPLIAQEIVLQLTYAL